MEKSIKYEGYLTNTWRVIWIPKFWKREGENGGNNYWYLNYKQSPKMKQLAHRWWNKHAEREVGHQTESDGRGGEIQNFAYGRKDYYMKVVLLQRNEKHSVSSSSEYQKCHEGNSCPGIEVSN